MRSNTAAAAAKKPRPRSVASVSKPSSMVHLVPKDGEEPKDHFIDVNGVRAAGRHLIIELWTNEGLADRDCLEKAFIDGADLAKATLLHIHLHTFGGGGGITGVVALAESHMSVHTWPENGYGAFDAFMCGKANPHKLVDVLREALKPIGMIVYEILRGTGGKMIIINETREGVIPAQQHQT